MNEEQAQTLCGRIPLDDRACWRVTGEDRVRYLNGQITQDVVRLPMGEAQAAALTTPKGRMVADVTIAKSPDALWVDAPLERREAVAARLEQYLIADDVLIEDVTESIVGWHVPQMAGVGSFAEGTTVFVSRRWGVPGRDIWGQKGAEPAGFSGPEMTVEQAELLRVEHALPRWGREMTEETLPPEVGMDHYAISYDKGCYVGQETIARIKSIGHVNRQLVYLEAVEARELQVPVSLLAAGKEVGKMTSAGWSPRLQKWIALGIVSRQHAALGSRLDAPQGTLIVCDPRLT